MGVLGLATTLYFKGLIEEERENVQRLKKEVKRLKKIIKKLKRKKNGKKLPIKLPIHYPDKKLESRK